MNLFAEFTYCDYCETAPKPSNPVLFHGFRDMDTGHLVCWNCRDVHYQNKNKSEHRGKHSEMPELII